jgi:hypothetical protein
MEYGCGTEVTYLFQFGNASAPRPGSHVIREDSRGSPDGATISRETEVAAKRLCGRGFQGLGMVLSTFRRRSDIFDLDFHHW